MSSHREALEISKDPVADSTDAYAFVSPDQPDTVTLISNYIPLQGSGGGPNVYEFGDDVRYEIHIDNNGDAKPDVTYRFEFTTEVRNQRTSSTTPARSTAWTTPTGPSAGILGDEAGRGRAAAGARQPGCRAPVQHRSPVDSRLRRPCLGSRQDPPYR
jgi:Domain of unknown function (DUF4331)